MPRGKKVKHARILVLYFDVSLYEELRGVAREMGVSMSELARHVLSEWMRHQRQEVQASASAPLDPPLDPPVRDPLEELELEEFEERLRALERDVGSLYQRFQQYIAQQGTHFLLKAAHDANLSALRSQAWDLVERWHKARKLYSRLPRSREHSARLAQVKRTLNELLRVTEPRR